MKRGKYAFLFIISLLLVSSLLIIPFISGFSLPNIIDIMGRLIEGKVTFGAINVSIFVAPEPYANLTIVNPLNNTYLKNMSLPLNFTSNGVAFWYNLNRAPNITITGNISFNTSGGSNLLLLYTNNSQGNITHKNITFNVNLTKVIIYYNESNGSTCGESTDYVEDYTYEQLGNISGMILENTDSGKIIFNELINLTDDENPGDNIINIDNHTDISDNRIEINSTALPNLNKTATLSLYGLTFTNPRILRNGEVCSDSICTQVSYSGGILIFNVTSFSIYSAEETPGVPGPSEEVIGGGGTIVFPPSIVPIVSHLSISPENIKVKMQPDGIRKEYLSIMNNLNKEIRVSIDFGELGEFITLLNEDDSSFSLGPKEAKTIQLIFNINPEQEPDAYWGYITITTNTEFEKQIKVIIEIEKEALFDVKVTIPSKYKILVPGEKLIAQIDLSYIKEVDERLIDVLVEYYIKDNKGEIIFQESETKAIEKQITFIKEIELPKYIKSGEYLFYVDVKYDDTLSISSAFFEVISERITKEEQTYIMLLILGIIIISLIIYSYERQKMKMFKIISRKVTIKDLYKDGSIKRK